MKRFYLVVFILTTIISFITFSLLFDDVLKQRDLKQQELNKVIIWNKNLYL